MQRRQGRYPALWRRQRWTSDAYLQWRLSRPTGPRSHLRAVMCYKRLRPVYRFTSYQIFPAGRGRHKWEDDLHGPGSHIIISRHTQYLHSSFRGAKTLVYSMDWIILNCSSRRLCIGFLCKRWQLRGWYDRYDTRAARRSCISSLDIAKTQCQCQTTNSTAALLSSLLHCTWDVVALQIKSTYPAVANCCPSSGSTTH